MMASQKLHPAKITFLLTELMLTFVFCLFICKVEFHQYCITRMEIHTNICIIYVCLDKYKYFDPVFIP